MKHTLFPSRSWRNRSKRLRKLKQRKRPFKLKPHIATRRSCSVQWKQWERSLRMWRLGGPIREPKHPFCTLLFAKRLEMARLSHQRRHTIWWVPACLPPSLAWANQFSKTWLAWSQHMVAHRAEAKTQRCPKLWSSNGSHPRMLWHSSWATITQSEQCSARSRHAMLSSSWEWSRSHTRANRFSSRRFKRWSARDSRSDYQTNYTFT